MLCVVLIGGPQQRVGHGWYRRFSPFVEGPVTKPLVIIMQFGCSREHKDAQEA